MHTKIKVIGEKGKMGSKVVSLLQKNSNFSLADSLENADVVIDFSSPIALKSNLLQVLKHKKPFVVGTTGHSPENLEELKKASDEIPILFSPNFSLGMAACTEAVALISKLLKASYRVEIIEKHHLHKKDKPSGTALALAHVTYDPKQTAIQSIREGEVVGEHRIIFSSDHERIEIVHEALERETFAEGALEASKFLADKTPGLYNLKELFDVHL